MSAETGSSKAHLALPSTLAGLAVIAGIGWLDVYTGPDWGFSLFYLMPILACGWWIGRRSALAAAIGGATAWLVADVLTHHDDHALVSSWNALTRLSIFVFVGLSVASSRRDRQRMSALLALAESVARTDALTGLANSRAFYERIASELPRLRRSGAPLCVAYVDLDNFKKVNDRFGHASGDALLGRIATLLRESVRAGDLVARLGGDELALVLWDCTSEDAEAICERVIARVRALESEYPGTGIGASVGIACFDEAPPDIDAVIAAADGATYEAKRAGKGRVALRVSGNSLPSTTESRA